MPLATEGTQEHIIIYCHAKTLGERHAARGRQPRRAGRAGANVSEREAGVRPRSRSFCCEKLYFGARPGASLWGQTRGLRFGARPSEGLFGDGEDEGGEGHEHGGHGEEDARGGAEEGVAGLRLLGLYVDHIILL